VEWPKKWEAGVEYQMAFDMSGAGSGDMCANCVHSLLSNLYHSQKTVCLWRQGLLNKDACCDVLLHFDRKKRRVHLATRLLDPTKRLLSSSASSNNEAIVRHLKCLFFEYYVQVVYALTVSNTPRTLLLAKFKSSLHTIRLEQTSDVYRDGINEEELEHNTELNSTVDLVQQIKLLFGSSNLLLLEE
jgi:hypothetical protein